jgi:6-pyruvoyltetrahydropterin/6-carboxytetrahydropterin synthase
MFELRRRYRFESAHRLPMVAPEHRCSRVHGHTYGVEIIVRGPLEPAEGWVMDYSKIDTAAQPRLDELDHHYLNDIEGLENPTSEHVARWLWERLAPVLPGLHAITIAENPDACCTYRGPAA